MRSGGSGFKFGMSLGSNKIWMVFLVEFDKLHQTGFRVNAGKYQTRFFKSWDIFGVDFIAMPVTFSD